MRAFRVAVCAVVLAGILPASVAAKTIVGTARNDVLKGTSKADKLYGKAGNDKLYGRGGNDLLVGGPGADRFYCVPGRDTVIADAHDKVAKDCEVVKGLTKPKPPPPPPPPSPPPPPTALPGHYCGFTNNGSGICFDVTPDGHSFTNADFGITTPCQPSSTFKIGLQTRGLTPIQPDLTFDFEDQS